MALLLLLPSLLNYKNTIMQILSKCFYWNEITIIFTGMKLQLFLFIFYNI